MTQPGKPQGRKRQVAPSPVAAAAAAAGFGAGSRGPLFEPVTPRDPAFLEAIEALAPDLAVTVAYGGLLPQRFLDCPPLGTLNIHPSLLPRWRGAAPVQRSLEAGDAVVGVSVAYTVLALDAGPVLAAERVPTPEHAAAPALLADLMARGGRLLLGALPGVWAGEGAGRAVAQDAAAATRAPRLAKADARLDLTQPLCSVYNRWRACAGWPTGWVAVRVGATDGPATALKLTAARPLPSPPDAAAAAALAAAPGGGRVGVAKDRLLFRCGDGGVLAATAVVPAGRAAMDAAAYVNGLAGAPLFVVGEGEEGGGGV